MGWVLRSESGGAWPRSAVIELRLGTRFGRPQRMRLQPECTGGGKWIYFGFTPRFFIAAAMNLTMMRATERYRGLVADFATERTRLREAQMVRI